MANLTNSRKRLHIPGPAPLQARAGVKVRQPKLLQHQRIPEGDWRGWMLLAGRGAGKTHAGACWLLDAIINPDIRIKKQLRLGVIAPTAADVRDVAFEGDSGILANAEILGLKVSRWNRSMSEAVINGAIVKGYAASEPNRLRGPQFHRLWIDELAAVAATSELQAQETFDNAMMGLRLGVDPRVLVTTTPRPKKIIINLVEDPDWVKTKANTTDNPFLATTAAEALVKRYAGTRIGRQELNAEILDDTPGALWTSDLIDDFRMDAPEDLERVVVGVDPMSGSSGGETGIIVAGRKGDDGYILADYTCSGSPLEWASKALQAYTDMQADLIIAERNNGGDMVEHTIRSTAGGEHAPIETVWASRGKVTRAEPIVALYEQGRIHHTRIFETLETQMCRYVPGETSPDRMDALVWALFKLFPVEDGPKGGFVMRYA